MYPLLIIREELICMTILLFLLINGRFYKMGKDHGPFLRMSVFALGHVVFDIVTVITVNHLDTVPAWVNYAAHVIFYLFALLFSYELFCYIATLCLQKNTVNKVRLLSLFPLAIYLCLLPVMSIEYLAGQGTNYSLGSAAIIGYGLGMLTFIGCAVLIIVHYKKLAPHVRLSLIPMLAFLVAVECIQIVVPELLLTGGAITVVTVGFFFSLENPADVFKQKLLIDAYTGVKSRHSYEIDIEEMEKVFAVDHKARYGLVFCDVNNLKAVNNTYGHLEGDAYISKIAQLLITDLRSADSIYRMGGDEFMAVFSGKDESVIQKEIGVFHEDCVNASKSLPYVMSVATGYSISGERHGNLRDVLREADYLMYKNKAEMKKRVAFISPDGQRLNISGLTDRIFDAFAETSNRFYLTICNLSTNVSRWSKSAVEYFGLPGEFIYDCMTVWMDFVHPDDRADYRADIGDVFSGNKKYHDIEYRARNKEGKYVVVTCRGTILRGKNGEPDMFAATLFNHGLSEDIDPITGLHNDHILIKYVDEIIHSDRKAALLQMGIYSFGRINLLYGYSNGNEVLRQFAEIMKNAVGDKGTIYRVDGAKFYLFLPDVTAKEADEIYKRIQDAAQHQIQLNGLSIPLRIAAGAYMLKGGCEGTSATVRNNLSYALELSKNKCHGRITFYGQRDFDDDNVDYRLLTNVHQDAIAEHLGFYLNYQPILSMDTGEITGAEALLRWRNNQYGEVGPMQFIPWLENDPCFFQLGRWILQKALEDSKKILALHPDFVINVNVTVYQLEDERFSTTVLDVLHETGFPPHQLCLELTERCRELDFDYLKEQIRFFQSFGIHVALDDVGTGFSSLDVLLKLPVNEIKLDKAFITDIRTRRVNQVIVRAIVDAARRMGYLCCLEGVEDEATYKFLKDFGASTYQGYYFSRPLSFEKLQALLAENRPTPPES